MISSDIRCGILSYLEPWRCMGKYLSPGAVVVLPATHDQASAVPAPALGATPHWEVAALRASLASLRRDGV